MVSLFSKLFETFSAWLKSHLKIEFFKTRTEETMGDMFERKEISEAEYYEFLGQEKTPYEKRISSYMERHPTATLAEARGHPPKLSRSRKRTRRKG